MKVCKFGGTSVASVLGARNIKKISQQPSVKFVVVSALGKTESQDKKITDLLFECYAENSHKKNCSKLIDEIFSRYQNLAKQLDVKLPWEKLKNKFVKDLSSGKNLPFIVSRGEYYSALIYSKYLGIKFLDAKDYIIFKNNEKIDQKSTKNRLKTLNFNKKYIIGGFYGATKEGEIKIFSRGGGDITGAIIAKFLNCDIYENYTDVDGVYDKNPNHFKSAKLIPCLPISWAITLAENGSGVVHKSALQILSRGECLIRVRNTYSPRLGGSILFPENFKRKE